VRFFSNGPSIPNELLKARDDGDVIFFCGAGISRNAGLPTFWELTERVIGKLKPTPASKAWKLFEKARCHPDFEVPLDQIFTLLQQEYGAGYIDSVVESQLKTPQRPKLDHHDVISRLSRNAAGQPQIVTTNFDLLFERAQKSLVRHVPPTLPDIGSGQPLHGLVYLHGRLTPRRSNEGERQGLILSSADFGRAYLADGWATRFVRNLLSKYVIVLLGYAAYDPPIRYLLEGLHSRGDDKSAKIYAFDQGEEREVRERWLDRGVHPLPYPASDKSHSALWESLAAWANRADNPDKWIKSTWPAAGSVDTPLS
jgi:hypothetical protein